jgi:dolichol-phosphate mannosyltransferase
MKLSIVSPVYKAAQILPELVRRINETFEGLGIDYEIVLVDDRSPDDSWEVLKVLASDNQNIKAFRLSRNFGQHYAITAGISKASGDLIIVMDCDLQDNPAFIPELIRKHAEGYNVVCTIKQQKEYSWYRRITSDMFFFVVNRLSDVKLEKNLGTMTLIDRRVADEYIKIRDYHRHSSMIFAWLGFNRGFVNVVQEQRFEGRSSYTLRNLIHHAINGVISQSDRLLRLSITFGMIMFTIALLGAGYIVVRSFFHHFEVGWPSLVVLILFTTSIILLMLGIAGLYIGKTFEQVKERPLFIIAEEAASRE